MPKLRIFAVRNFVIILHLWLFMKANSTNSQFLAKIERTKSAITVHQNDIFFKENTLSNNNSPTSHSRGEPLYFFSR